MDVGFYLRQSVGPSVHLFVCSSVRMDERTGTVGTKERKKYWTERTSEIATEKKTKCESELKKK